VTVHKPETLVNQRFWDICRDLGLRPIDFTRAVGPRARNYFTRTTNIVPPIWVAYRLLAVVNRRVVSCGGTPYTLHDLYPPETFLQGPDLEVCLNINVSASNRQHVT